MQLKFDKGWHLNHMCGFGSFWESIPKFKQNHKLVLQLTAAEGFCGSYLNHCSKINQEKAVHLTGHFFAPYLGGGDYYLEVFVFLLQVAVIVLTKEC